MTIPEILENDWFKKGYKPPQFQQEEGVSLDDIDAVFNDSEVTHFNGREGLGFNILLRKCAK